MPNHKKQKKILAEFHNSSDKNYIVKNLNALENQIIMKI